MVIHPNGCFINLYHYELQHYHLHGEVHTHA